MAFSMFDDRDGFIDEADPVSPLSNPDAGTGTAVLERPEEETKLDDGGNGDADRFAHYVSRDRIAESRRTGRRVVRLWRCAARCGCRSVILRSSRYVRIASVSTTK